ncbi:MAG: RNA-binding S4 domain-containing protein [Pseudomonadota bacterium]
MADADADTPRPTIRLDRWLFFSRLVKSRSLASKLIEAGGVRVNGTKTHRSNRTIGPEDVLTIALPVGVKIIKLRACGSRRGPAPEAQQLYEDLTPPPPPKTEQDLNVGNTAPNPGRRPTKHERERLSRMKRQAE